MRKLMMIGLAIVSLTFACNVQAQNKRWSLQECIDHAIRHNIEVKQSRKPVKRGISVLTEKEELCVLLSSYALLRLSERPKSNF